MLVCGTWFLSHITHKHMSNGPVVFTSLVTTSSQKLSCYNTPIKMTWFQTQLRQKTKRNTWKTWFEAQRFNGFHCFSPHRHHNSFIPRASTILSGVSPIRKTSGPRLCADGPDKARKTLMFIRRSLYRFHRCQSGKVTVTAPIKENGQNGNKGTDWEPKLGNNTSLTNDYSWLE